jgi:sugar (pentulose or hexulose) kinase
MTRSTLFNRIQCDMLQRPLLRFRGNEATAQGAWIAACVACGLAADHRSAFARLAEREAPEAYQPDPTTRDAYHRLRLRAQAAYDALAAPRLRAAFGSPEQT